MNRRRAGAPLWDDTQDKFIIVLTDPQHAFIAGELNSARPNVIASGMAYGFKNRHGLNSGRTINLF
jgi:hypothetical protein